MKQRNLRSLWVIVTPKKIKVINNSGNISTGKAEVQELDGLGPPC